MERFATWVRSRTAVVVAGLVFVAALLRWIVVGQDPFADELSTLWIISTNDLGGVLDTVHTDTEITPPLGFMLSWLATQIDLSVELMRLPAFIAGVVSIPLVYAIGTRTVGRGAALLAATLTTLSPFMIFYSAEARGYGVMMALVLVAVLSALLAIDDYRRRWWVAYAVAASLAMYTHYMAVFALLVLFVWVLWAEPLDRRPMLFATGAAVVLYLPWASGFLADLDSPTTEILGVLSPSDLGAIGRAVGNWALGFPYATVAGLDELPGVPALLLVAAAFLVGGFGMLSSRDELWEWFENHERRILLVGALALATPVGALIVSAMGTSVLNTRNLAASWPFLAIAVSALLTVGTLRNRLLASGLAVAAFAIAAAGAVSDDFRRPAISEASDLVPAGPHGVVVDGASFSPGPLGNFDVPGVDPGVEVIRLSLPEERDRPFGFMTQAADVNEVANAAVAAADGGPITLITTDGPNPIPGAQLIYPRVLAFEQALPYDYEQTSNTVVPGMIDLRVTVYEREGGSSPG